MVFQDGADLAQIYILYKVFKTFYSWHLTRRREYQKEVIAGSKKQVTDTEGRSLEQLKQKPICQDFKSSHEPDQVI